MRRKQEMKTQVYNLETSEKTQMELNPNVFDLELNEELIHQVYVAHYSNKRQTLAHTKTRAERAGSGKKPWKQKGTGRARTGSVRNPIWRKGGVTFGPRNERNFSKKINKKMNQIAFKMVLGGKLKDNELVVIEKNKFKENKTKEAVGFLKKNEFSKSSLLWVFEDGEKNASKVTRNIDSVKNVSLESLNIFDMLNCKFLVLSKKAVEIIQERYGKKIDEKETVKNTKKKEIKKS